MLLPGNTANTQHPHKPRKEKILCYTAHVCNRDKFTPVTFQIDTAATCNTLSEDTLLRLMPSMKLRKSPYLLHPYGDSQPLKPLAQIDLLCERNKRSQSLTFQILPTDVMMNKPALLSGSRGTGAHHHHSTRNIFTHISSKRLVRQESPCLPNQLVTTQSRPR